MNKYLMSLGLYLSANTAFLLLFFALVGIPLTSAGFLVSTGLAIILHKSFIYKP